MSETAKRTDPGLWEKVKEEVTQGSKGGKKGQWSARKAQMAVREYKKAGGGYEGETADGNSLERWQEEDWGTKSGKPSGETGERYLPKGAREELSDEEYARTSAKKRKDTKQGRQFSKQPKDVAKKAAKHRGEKGEPTKTDLYAQAKKLGIEGRSKMGKAELKRAVERHG